MRNRKRSVLLLLLVLAAVSASAQRAVPKRGQQTPYPAATFSGVATDPSGAIIPGTMVLLVDLAAVEATIVLSDMRGRFEFGKLHAGREYEVRLQASGFSRIVQRIELKPGENELRFVLMVGSGGGVEVSGTAPESPGGSKVEYGIHGTVIDQTGAVVPGSMLLLIHWDSLEVRKGKADSEGHYMFRNLQVGAYEVIAGNSSESECFDPTFGWVTVKPNESYQWLRLQLKMSKRCPPEIEVTGPNYPIPTSK